jgi:hypothetical protein
VLMFEVSLERLEPCTIRVAIGKPLSVLAAIRMTNDHDKLGCVVVVACFEFQGFVVAFKNHSMGHASFEGCATVDPGP